MPPADCDGDDLDLATTGSARSLRVSGEAVPPTDGATELTFEVTNTGDGAVSNAALRLDDSGSQCLWVSDRGGDGRWTDVRGTETWRPESTIDPGETRRVRLRVRVQCPGVATVRFGPAVGAIVPGSVPCGQVLAVSVVAGRRIRVYDRAEDYAVDPGIVNDQNTVGVGYEVTSVGTEPVVDGVVDVASPRWWDPDPGERGYRSAFLPQLDPGDHASGIVPFEPPSVEDTRRGRFGIAVRSGEEVLARRRTGIQVVP